MKIEHLCAIAIIGFFFISAFFGFVFNDNLIEYSCYKNQHFYIGNQKFICMEAE